MRFSAKIEMNLRQGAVISCLLISSLVMAQSWSSRMVKLEPDMPLTLNGQLIYSSAIDIRFTEANPEHKKRDVLFGMSIELEDELPSRPKINDFFAYTLSIQKMCGDLVLSLNLENMLHFSSDKILNEASLNRMGNGDSTLMLESESTYLLGLGIAYTF